MKERYYEVRVNDGEAEEQFCSYTGALEYAKEIAEQDPENSCEIVAIEIETIRVVTAESL